MPSAREGPPSLSFPFLILATSATHEVGGVHSIASPTKSRIGPIRHATATHLLQSGVDISVIALWLSHESIDTTHIYMESNLTHKEEALGLLQPAGQRTPRFHATDKVMAFLDTL
ncbi:hypothetical protein WS90_03745 [Burkholderia cepacia]|uniref:Tyr recombinase domain-containing protein n=1 Tax=Burkholderia cepacia TaxID=292 RepID=A0A124SKU0_BURCE|nr:hypothetical protein WS90_03745 [Burkholderia cepacia]